MSNLTDYLDLLKAEQADKEVEGVVNAAERLMLANMISKLTDLAMEERTNAGKN